MHSVDPVSDDLQCVFDTQGYVVLPSALPVSVCDRLVDAISRMPESRTGTRRLLREPAVRDTAETLRCHPAIATLLGPDMHAVQCTLFTKELVANWSVTPHQDLSVPVRERVDAPDWSGRCTKKNVIFAQPPRAILERLVAIRLQLDPNAETSGPLDIVPGSHREGRLSHAEIL